MTELKESIDGLSNSITKLKRRMFIATIMSVFGTGFVLGIIVGLFIAN